MISSPEDSLHVGSACSSEDMKSRQHEEKKLLPTAWHPTSCSALTDGFEQEAAPKESDDEERRRQQQQFGIDLVIANTHEQQSRPDAHNSSFLPPSLDSDAIADTIKSFFPAGGASAEASSSAMQFQSFPTPDLLSRNGCNSQDLRLSVVSRSDFAPPPPQSAAASPNS